MSDGNKVGADYLIPGGGGGFKVQRSKFFDLQLTHTIFFRAE